VAPHITGETHGILTYLQGESFPGLQPSCLVNLSWNEHFRKLWFTDRQQWREYQFRWFVSIQEERESLLTQQFLVLTA
jgi:hypothetical protein